MARKRRTRKSYRRQRTSYRGRRTHDPVSQVWRMLPWPLKRALFASPGGAIVYGVWSSLG